MLALNVICLLEVLNLFQRRHHFELVIAFHRGLVDPIREQGLLGMLNFLGLCYQLPEL